MSQCTDGVRRSRGPRCCRVTNPRGIAVCCAPQGISDVLVGEDVALERGGHVVQVIERDGHIFGVAVAICAWGYC